MDFIQNHTKFAKIEFKSDCEVDFNFEQGSLTAGSNLSSCVAGENNCDNSMSSYFANSYMPDLRNGGVSAEHPHQHQHYGAAVQVPPQGTNVQTDPNSCGGDPSVGVLNRQGIPPHHYGGPPTGGQPPQGMPYPRFPPYDRMDIRNAAYYQQQMDNGVYRPDSPTNIHMGGNGPPNGHQTPVVYASCKLQAAAVGQSVLGSSGSPPLDGSGAAMGHHGMTAHDHQQHPHMNAQPAHTQLHPGAQHPQNAQHGQAQQHMMYGGVQHNNGPNNMHQQVSGQVPPPGPQSQGAQQPPVTNTAASLPSPLYPWMRSQFGKYLQQTAILNSRYFGYISYILQDQR